MKVYEAVANAFLKEGTTTVFGLMGDQQINWWAALAKHPGTRMVDARHEGAAVSMADGWARATGEPGVCSVHYGPGVSHMTTSLLVSARQRTPIVVFTSRTPYNNHQHLDQSRLVSATGAEYIEVTSPDLAEIGVRQAFYRARVESIPVVLSVNSDVIDQDCDSDPNDYHPTSALLLKQQRIRPDPERIEEAAAILAASRRPVVIVGRGAMDGSASAAALRLAERIGALTATSLVAKGTLADNPFHAGICGMFATRTTLQLFAEADCAIAIGASLNLHTLAGGYVLPHARMIQVGLAPHLLMGNESAADVYIQGDALATLEALEEALRRRDARNEGFRTAEVRERLRGKDIDPKRYEIEPGMMDPRDAMRVIDERLPSEVGLVNGIGHASTFPIMVMQKRRAPHVFVTGFSSIGQVLATAIGVAVAGMQPLLAVEGDGGAMQNIQELDTAARLRLKLLYVVLNDEAYGAEWQRVKLRGLDPELGTVRSPDFAMLAQAMGCKGRIARNAAEVAAAVDEFMAGDGPMLLDVRTSKNVISITYRRIHYGEDA